ncbi:hypothetical protein FDP41_008583 [Naegleria fowleri]|uniref:Calcineurin-like phosphoesterase domain-containing protein n=1 Tax=Naegleria fowleri TaxID=5763 RepID=A0A6A5BFG6_NAEFO|nr:uncharacterized protein FDP41_008583 [Naegleria fowleri]KAF0973376.1 hypothetical protein FDP41_008583 [Naegleria fowleri]CAG4716446.1 unnamed protein product [Naegleria fowleri]
MIQSSSPTFIEHVPKRLPKNTTQSVPIVPMKFVVISDTHLLHDLLIIPNGDVLIHCGDFTNLGLSAEVEMFFQFLVDKCDSKFEHVIMIVGNHEWAPDVVVGTKFNIFFSPENQKKLHAKYHLLLDDTITIKDKNQNAIKIHGTRYRGAWAFPVFFKDKRKKTTFEIPSDIDILLTHFPCNKNKLDIIYDGTSRGSEELTMLLESDNYFTNLKIHCFGHNHDGRGFYYDTTKDRLYINAVSVIGDKRDKIVEQPFVFEF